MCYIVNVDYTQNTWMVVHVHCETHTFTQITIGDLQHCKEHVPAGRLPANNLPLHLHLEQPADPPPHPKK